MKSVIYYRLENCENCHKCLLKCPTGAISMKDNKISIDNKKCIHCDHCIEICENRGFKVKNEHMEDTFSSYDYKVVLVPTSLLSDFKNHTEAKQTFKAIQALGFDEVLQYSDIEGAMYLETMNYVENQNELKITSFCPTINKLIETNYPTLIDHLLPFEYPVEVAAKKARERLKDKGRVGIYSLCECVAKMTLAKYPYGNHNSNIDHAMSISHVFPKINRLKNKEELDLEMSLTGIQSVVSDFFTFGQGSKPLVSVEGINNVKKILELAEFGHMDDIGILGLFACYKGCIGGYFLWSNPFIGRINIDQFVENATTNITPIHLEDYYKTHIDKQTKQPSMKERMKRFKQISEILNTLPQFDCGACGYPNCRTLAEQIVDQQDNIETCRVRGGQI